MTINSIGVRRQRYFKLSSQIAQMDNARLRSLFEASESAEDLRRIHTLDIEGCKVFVKRVPLTDTEQENLFSTRNLYNLPTCYHYGVGSVGFGGCRELVANIKTTNWVLDGQIETFPLLYHYWILPFSGKRSEPDMAQRKRYIEYWGGNESIDRYMLDRNGARYELALFLEHIPHVLEPWLQAHPGKLDDVIQSLRATVDFLRKNGILHFDVHFHNIVTDGERPYLTDFGLVLDKSFDLAEDERAFFSAHTHYDYGAVLYGLGYLLYTAYVTLPESSRHALQAKYGMEELQPAEYLPVLLDNIEEICATEGIRLDESDVNCLVRYRSVLALMYGFFTTLRRNNRKDTPFPQAELQRRLKETGFLFSQTEANSPVP